MLAFNVHTLTARWALGEDIARVIWKRTRHVLLIHAGRLIERGPQLIHKRCAKQGRKNCRQRSRVWANDLPRPCSAGRPTLHSEPPETPRISRIAPG